jgi:two-component system, OmpR family, phosphate regulon response regulator PhoB
MTRLLIVEDQPEIRMLIQMALEFEDFEIHEAADGDAALVQLPTLKPDLVLLDVLMPGSRNGLDVCRAIKADAGLRGTRVVMLSARSQPSDRQAGLAAGADAYLVKPFSPNELLRLIGKLLPKA